MAKAKKSVLPSREPAETLTWLWAEAQFQARYPAIYEFLAAGIYEGDPRKGGSISLFVGSGRLKVCFLDKHTQQAFYGVLEPKSDILQELEELLSGEHEPWIPVGKNPAKPVF